MIFLNEILINGCPSALKEAVLLLLVPDMACVQQMTVQTTTLESDRKW
ncbi:hypothetical protein BofuT4_uP051450.1 [Botrytis cinerea T4]|uniref:Uncharacterized protein n=1 Tax=Botryotinia fuckeliana (strain T4) TaxID=999810 RepID=G2XWW8_BOTF4|nr:hypothetical protein BofuT4_uP051450.1 [Botrytis cinerea T4]